MHIGLSEDPVDIALKVERAPRLGEKFTGSLSDLWGELSPTPRPGKEKDSTSGPPINEQRDLSRLKASLSNEKGRAPGIIGKLQGKKIPEPTSSFFRCDGENDCFNALGRVPEQTSARLTTMTGQSR